MISASKGLIRITDREYKLIRDLVYDRFGINLTEQKRSLVIGRLNSLLKSMNFTTFKEYYDHVVADTSGQSSVELIDRISTNHTFFNRESDHFDYFSKTALPELESIPWLAKEKTLKVWVAGCSSGEEPYMLGMLLQEYFRANIKDWDLGILATDIYSRTL